MVSDQSGTWLVSENLPNTSKANVTLWIYSKSLISNLLKVCPCQARTQMNPDHMIKSIDKSYFTKGRAHRCRK